MFGFNSGYVEDLYAQYLQNPESVSPSWRDFFSDFDPGPTYTGAIGAPPATAPGKTTNVAAAPEERPGGDGAAPVGAAPAAARPASPPAPAAPAPAPPPLAAAPSPSTSPPSAPSNGPARPSVAVPPCAAVAPLRGVAQKIVENMEASLTIPTATSVREIPVKVLAENRRLINRRQAATGGEKVSFTHLIAYAIVEAIGKVPAMNAFFRHGETSGERVEPEHLAFGLAIDVERKGGRQLLVPNVKAAETLSFAEFLGQYNDIVRRARDGRLEVADYAGTTLTLTNPGGIGTAMSVPRLMPGQGVIVAVGAIGFPPEYAGMRPADLSKMGLSEVMAMTSTYDHRVIQGAESGEFLAHVARLLTGGEGFYERAFRSLGIYTPAWTATADTTPSLGRSPRDERGRASKTEKQARVYELIRAYRVRGHLVADTNPLGYAPDVPADLTPAFYGLTVWDLDREFLTGALAGTRTERLPLRDLLDRLWDTYTDHVGSEFMHLTDLEEKQWLVERIERTQFRDPLPTEQKARIFAKLNAAEAIEQFIHTKYVGHKRFSLEGGETVIATLDALLTDAADGDVQEAVLGMAHRGRLNVLTNTIGKPYKTVFAEFEGTIDPGAVQGSGDVKYHLGQTGTHTAPSGRTVELLLAANPSHLEAVNPVVEGMVRAKQQRLLDADPEGTEDELRDHVLPVLIHGDAAFAGQGVVAETLNLSQLVGYRTGGTVHLVVNNQIGFTTLPEHSRSSNYATDIARMIQAPIFHVNGDDPEACVRVARLAFAYRQRFNKDVVVDVVCYRKYGHNEGDEPSYTQPQMYDAIRGHRSVRKLYLERLLRRGEITPEDAERVLDDFRARLDTAFEETKGITRDPDPVPPSAPADPNERVRTAVERPVLERVVRTLSEMPEGVTVHPKLGRLLAKRPQLFETGQIEWAFAEALAFGSLLAEGTRVRLSGQDSGRGTFSQRHAVLHDQAGGPVHVPLNHIPGPDGEPGSFAEGTQARFEVYDSLLSEYAVLGFEYGYTVADPHALVLWEAQFGDFGNGAQIMIDQFIASAEAKWGQTSRLVMLLPHGYEGQGPEHSSARLERFLQLCAEDNMVVANYSTPANYFHALRRQVRRGPAKPLVVMTPKSLLRLPQAVSRVEDFTEGHYQPFIPSGGDPAAAERLVLCSGKVYYEAVKAREGLARPETVAVARLEQFYPFPEADVRAEFERFRSAKAVWLQEEPQNMGAWSFVAPRLDDVLEGLHAGSECPPRVRYAGRRAAASPATGSAKVHAREQADLLRDALGAPTGGEAAEAAAETTNPTRPV